MNKSGEALAAPLEAMLRAARLDLPEVANALLAANRAVASTSDYDNALAGHPTHHSWRNLRDELQRILGKTAVVVKDSATALERVVHYYTEADEAAAAELANELVGEDHGTRPHIDDPEMP